jgi:hypothetical protein
MKLRFFGPNPWFDRPLPHAFRPPFGELLVSGGPNHWRHVPATAWRWPNFSAAEIACRGTGKHLVNEAALDALRALRIRLGKPLNIRSAYRSPEHNRAAGGAKASKHMEGIAFATANHDPRPSKPRPARSGSRGSTSIRARVHLHRPRAGAELGRPLREAGDAVRRGDAAGARDAEREPDPEDACAAGVATAGAAGV